MPAKAATAIISLSTNFGYVGDTVIVSTAAFGSGFDIVSSITIKFDGTTLATTPSQVTTNILGGFTANFTVPNATVGSHTVNATDANGNSGVALFTVNAPLAVVVSPASWVMDVGQSKTFTATPSGGSGSYSVYHWYVGGVVQAGQTNSTFSYSAVSVGSYSIAVTVTDSLGTTSAQSSATVNVNAVPTVSVSPIGPLKMDVGQFQVFTASAVGGSGTLHYQWYVDGGVVGSNSASYSYTAAGSSHSVTCKVTDSASPPVTSVASNTVSVTVSPALTAPTVSASPITVNQGQASSLSSTVVSTGTSPYTYQWLSRAPNVGSYASISGATSSSYSFVTSSSTITGVWSFILQVRDAVNVAVNSSVVSVTVNAPLAVVVSPASWVMDVGQSKTFTATPSGGSGSYSVYHWYVGGVVQAGQTNSTFSYSAVSVGSYSIAVTVTDSLGTTSAQSSATSVTTNTSPTVTISPNGTLTKNFGQTQIFTATPIGGSGTIHYQWYVDSSTIGTDNPNYTYTVPGAPHSITCIVTDSASVPVTSPASNAVIITSNPALVAPTISASPGTINQGQNSILTSTSVSTGTSPYSYQWFQKVPGGNFAVVGSNTASFTFVTSGTTATGSWSFILQVTDTAGSAVNSSAVSVTVNVAPLDHFIFSSVGVQTAGVPFTITITAKNPFNTTLTNYSGTNILNVSTGTISPATTGAFSNGSWTGLVTLTDAGSGIWLITSGSGMSGTSDTFTINPSALDHFAFTTITSQTAGSAFNITVTAKDTYNNTITNYAGTPSLTYSAGTINPTIMGPFVNGIGTTQVTVTAANSNAKITATDDSSTGISNSFTVSPAPTTSPGQTTSPTAKPSPNPSTTPSPTPSPTIPPSETSIPATTESGTTVYIAIQGNITNSQITDATITTDNSATTTISFKLTGEDGTFGYCNMTIPKTAVPYGATPTLFIDGIKATNQGFTQDTNNFYVWYTTEFSIHEMKIQFVESPTIQLISFGPVLAVIITIPEIILIYTVIAVRRLRRKPENA